MPWLAPIGTPADNGAIDSQVPIWQSIRAVEIAGFGLHARQPVRQHRQSLAPPGRRRKDGPRREQMPSTQWSTARMPVDRNSHSGVCTVIDGIEDRRARHH